MVRPLLLQYHSRPITCVRYNRDGDLFLSSSNDGKVCLIRSDTGERVGVYEGHDGAVKSCDINLESTLVVSCGADSKVCFYEAETGMILHKHNHGGILQCVEFNQNPAHNDKIVTCANKFRDTPNCIQILQFGFQEGIDEQSGNPTLIGWCEKLLQFDEQLPMKATKVKWGPFDETIISIHEEGTFCVWNIADQAQILLIDGHEAPITGIQFNVDRTLMVTSSRDRSVKLWETEKYSCVKQYQSNRPFNDAAISPLYKDELNPKFHILAGGGVEARDAALVTEGGFETVLFNMVMEEEIGQIKGHFGPMNSLSISPDGKSYVTGGEEGLIRLIHWDPDYFSRKDL